MTKPELPHTSKSPIVNSFVDRGVRYELRHVSCGKANCTRCYTPDGAVHGHGPYWYLNVETAKGWTRIYLGKTLNTSQWRLPNGKVDWDLLYAKKIYPPIARSAAPIAPAPEPDPAVAAARKTAIAAMPACGQVASTGAVPLPEAPCPLAIDRIAAEVADPTIPPKSLFKISGSADAVRIIQEAASIVYPTKGEALTDYIRRLQGIYNFVTLATSDPTVQYLSRIAATAGVDYHMDTRWPHRLRHDVAHVGAQVANALIYLSGQFCTTPVPASKGPTTDDGDPYFGNAISSRIIPNNADCPFDPASTACRIQEPDVSIILAGLTSTDDVVRPRTTPPPATDPISYIGADMLRAARLITYKLIDETAMLLIYSQQMSTTTIDAIAADACGPSTKRTLTWRRHGDDITGMTIWIDMTGTTAIAL